MSSWAQKCIHEKTNEIPVFQKMLTYLEIEGKTITADAMHCQRENCRKIQEISWLKEHKWSGLQSIFSIERMVDVRRHHSKETSYYISSRDVSVKQLMELAREH